jgi:hypothetical protein
MFLDIARTFISPPISKKKKPEWNCFSRRAQWLILKIRIRVCLKGRVSLLFEEYINGWAG